MKIISWNVNGVRAAHKKGLMDYIAAADADVFCIQETKAHLEQLSKEIYAPEGYQSWWQSAERRGYSGTAIWAKREPDSLEPLGVEEFDNEGRMQVAIFGDMAILNGYFPNSQAEGARLTYKLGFNAAVKQRADALAAEGKPSSSPVISMCPTNPSIWPGRRKTREIPVIFPKRGPGWTPSSTAAGPTHSECSTRVPKTTHGGLIGVEPGPGMWDGDWTTSASTMRQLKGSVRR
jgi:hypothetical protein